MQHRLPMLAVCGLLGLTVAACTSDNTYLPALLADPMADYEAEGIVLVDAWEQPQHPGNFWTRRTHAMARRSYQIQDQSQVEQALREAVAFAEAAGWRMQRDITIPTLYLGAKSLQPGDGRLSIALGASDPLNDPDGPRGLTILLDFGPVRFHESTTTGPEGG